MGPEYAVLFFWAAQVAVGAVMALCHAIRRQWLLSLGIIVGLVAGLFPLYFWKGQDLLAPISLLALVSIFVLIIAYAIGRRWVPVAITVGLFALLIHGVALPMSLRPAALSPLQEYGVMVIFFGPIITAVAAREIVRRIRPLPNSI